MPPRRTKPRCATGVAVPPAHSGAPCGRRTRRTPRAPAAGWCGAGWMPRCSGVKQKVTVTSKSSSAAICRSNQRVGVGAEAVGPAQARCADGVTPRRLSQRTASSSRWSSKWNHWQMPSSRRVVGEVRAAPAWACRPRAAGPCGSGGSSSSPRPRGAAWSRARPCGRSYSEYQWMRGTRPISSSAVRCRPNSCTSSAPKVETPTSVTHTGRCVTAWISAMRVGPLVDLPVVPVEREAVHRHRVHGVEHAVRRAAAR